MSSFQLFIRSVLKENSGLSDQVIDKLTDEKGIIQFQKAFTHISYDPVENYEFLEHLGDATLNSILPYYFYTLFPQLDCPEGVEFMTRLSVVGVSKETFAHIARKLGFDQHIRYITGGKTINPQSLAEDVFEAFAATLKLQMDLRYPGTGYVTVENFVFTVLKPFQISLRFEDLWDGKTIAKELQDKYKKINKLYDLKLEYIANKEPHEYKTVYRVDLYATVPSSTIPKPEDIDENDKPVLSRQIIGFGYSSRKGTAEQMAAQEGIIYLKKIGYEPFIHTLNK